MSAPQQPSGDFPAVDRDAPRLELVLEAESGSTQRIPCHRVLTLLGSRPGCRIALKHPRISPVHVALVNDGSRVFAVDLASVAGTNLNGLRLQHEELSDGDLLSVADWTFRVEIEKADSPHGTQVFTGELEPTPESVAFEHLSSGRFLKPNRNLCVIGRRKSCDIAISEARISRAHAVLFFHLGRPAIADLLTENGTRVNDKRVTFQLLKSDDEIRIGETRFRVHHLGVHLSVPESDNGSPAQPSDGIAPEEAPPDLIDIHATESKQRWRIAEHLEQRSRRR